MNTKFCIFIPDAENSAMFLTIVFSLTFMVLLLIIMLIRWFLRHTKNVTVELFAEGLRNENKGDYEAALIAYENALDKVKKSRFRSNSLKTKIVEKRKVLNTVIAYKNNSQCRQVI
jgi:hypothetical protein